MEYFQQLYTESEFTEKQIFDIFDDEKEGIKTDKDANVPGWSFVKMTESHLEIAENN